MELKVYIKSVYGNDLIYPKCSKSKLIANALLGRKTLTNTDIHVLKELGYVIKVETESDIVL